MRKPYSGELKKQFSEMVLGLGLPFEKFKGKSEYLFPSVYPHVYRVDEKLWLFILLYINPKGYQSFTVQFGWSLFGRFPEVTEGQFITDQAVNKERFKEPEFMQRISIFCGPDTWWFLEGTQEDALHGHMDFQPQDIASEEAKKAVSKALSEVKKALDDKLIPYLKEFLEWSKPEQSKV